MHLIAWPTLSSRFHKTDFLESFYIGAEKYKILLYDFEIDVLNRKVVRPVKPFRQAQLSDLLIKVLVAIKKLGWVRKRYLREVLGNSLYIRPNSKGQAKDL